MDHLRELYQEVILDHNHHPRNFHALPACDYCAQGLNPLCGDELKLFIKADADVISEIGFTGKGCAISTASASLMTESLKAKTFSEARNLFQAVHSMLTDETVSVEEAALGKLAVLAGVRAFPARVKCASLAWHTLVAALDNQDEVTTEA